MSYVHATYKEREREVRKKERIRKRNSWKEKKRTGFIHKNPSNGEKSMRKYTDHVHNQIQTIFKMLK